MPNHHLRDENLSLKACGLLSKMLSLPPNWDYSFNGLVKIKKEGRDSVRSALDELKRLNYLKITKERGEKGYFRYIYHVYKNPCEKHLKNEINPDTAFPYTDNPVMDNPELDEPVMDNLHQLNTNKLNNKELNNNISNIKNKKDKLDKSYLAFDQMNMITKSLIKKHYIDEDDSSIFRYNDFFEELLENGHSYRELLDDCSYVISKVQSRNYLDENGNQIKDKFNYLKSSILARISRLNYLNEESEEYDWLNDDFEL